MFESTSTSSRIRQRICSLLVVKIVLLLVYVVVKCLCVYGALFIVDGFRMKKSRNLPCQSRFSFNESHVEEVVRAYLREGDQAQRRLLAVRSADLLLKLRNDLGSSAGFSLSSGFSELEDSVKSRVGELFYKRNLLELEHLSFISYAGTKQKAMDLVASMVDLPERAATVSLVQFCGEELKNKISDMALLVKPEKRPPKLLKMQPSQRQQYVQLLSRLLANGQVIVDDIEPKEVNGLFVVEKDDGMLRLIVDGRRGNLHLKQPDKVVLPNPGHLAELRVDDGEVIYVAKLDVQSYFNQLNVEGTVLEYVYGLPPLRPEEAVLLGLDPSRVYPRMRSLPMGSSWSVLLAQAVIENVILTRTDITEDQFLHRGARDLKRGVIGIYVDDVFILSTKRDVCTTMFTKVHGAISSTGLPLKLSKIVEPTDEEVEVVGLRLIPKLACFVPKPASFQELIRDTLQVIEHGVATGKAMEQLVGRWVWFCMLQRKLLAILNAVYHFIRKARDHSFTLWKNVKAELMTLVLMAPMFRTSLRRREISDVVATDASSSGGAVVMSYRVAEDEMVNVRGLPHPASMKESGSFCSDADGGWMLPRKFVTLFRWRWKFRSHINKLELLSILLGVQRLASQERYHRKEVFWLVDSQVCFYALNKGRTSSFLLKDTMRRIVGYSLAVDLHFHFKWIPTDLNPADAPSRL